MKQLKIIPRYTHRDSISLERYLSEIRKIDLLSAEEEVELARRIRNGDEEALDKLVRANLRFVVSVAKQYGGQGLSLDDLINEGNVGLIKAAERFDETMGFKFISYAVWWVRQAILQAIIDHSRLVRLPVNKAYLYNRINRAHQEFLQKYERPPSTVELAEIFELSVTEVEEIIANGPRHVSLDAPIGSDEHGDTLMDTYEEIDGRSPDIKLIEDSLKQEIWDKIQSLSRREIKVLQDFFGLDGKKAVGLEEIAHGMGLSHERVRQIKDRAIHRLRKKIKLTNLSFYLD